MQQSRVRGGSLTNKKVRLRVRRVPTGEDYVLLGKKALRTPCFHFAFEVIESEPPFTPFKLQACSAARQGSDVCLVYGCLSAVQCSAVHLSAMQLGDFFVSQEV